MSERKFRILHFFCGMGGKGLGAKEAAAVFGDHTATFETIGGIDFDAKACRDFEMLVGAPTLCIDVHKLEPEQLRAFAGDQAPDAIMMSPPCKGFSGLLSAKRAAEEKYQLIHQLMLRALFLCVSTWPTMPPLIFGENVPRIASRGRELVAKALAIGVAHGYAVTTGTHDCGELGNLAQHRRRWFMVWRHREQVPQLLYQPPKFPVRACGEVLGPLPMPGDVEAAGPMHAVPRLSWRNWLRLALIPAGGDWRDLPGTLANGERRREKFRRAPVAAWDATAETVTGPGGSAAAAVADPRVELGLGCAPRAGAYGVVGFDESSAAVIGEHRIDTARAAIADPRTSWFNNVYRVLGWDAAAGTVTGAGKPSSGAFVVADPRFGNVDRVTPWNEAVGTITRSPAPSSGGGAVADPRWGGGRFGVTAWDEPNGTVAGESLPNNGKFSVADPRFTDGKKKNWQQVAGVTAWTSTAPTVTSGAKIHSGAFQVADPRIELLAPRYRVMTLAEALALDLNPDRPPPFIPVIIAADGTWHRPLTTLELAVLQSFPWWFNGAPLLLAGTSHTRWREAIGNAVPPRAGKAVADQLLLTLLVSSIGAWTMSPNEVWVAPDRRALVA